MSNISLKKQLATLKKKQAEENERKRLKKEIFYLKHRKKLGIVNAIGSGVRKLAKKGRKLNIDMSKL